MHEATPGAGLSLAGATSLTRCDRPTTCQAPVALRQAATSRTPMVATGATRAPCALRSPACLSRARRLTLGQLSPSTWPLLATQMLTSLACSPPRRLPRPPSASPALATSFSPSARRLAAPTGQDQRCTAAAARKANGNAVVGSVAATKLPTAHSAASAATHALGEANASPSLIRHS